MRNRPLEMGELVGGRYRVAGLLGAGGMSRVYAAEDLKLRGKLRAVKQLSANPWDAEYLSAEADVLMSLQHPHLPQIIDYIGPSDDDPALLITDLVEGESLLERFERCGCRLPVREIMDAALQLCRALSYLHSQHPPVIHRDLKPSNVMIEQSGFVRLIDFGIARQVRNGSDTLHLGTPGFAAPEQGGEKGRSDERSDIYGLGALMFYLLSGGNHYIPGQTELRELRSPDMRQEPIRVLERMLRVQPDHRYQAVSEVESALAAIPFHSHNMYRPNDTSNTSSAGRAAGKTIAVASIAPGAGATFIAVSLAKLLTSQGISNVYVEHYNNHAEAYGLLNGPAKDIDPFPVKREQRQQFVDSRYAFWQEGAGQVLALRMQSAKSTADEDRKFQLMVSQTEAEIIIYDISSHWREAEGMKLLAACDICLFAADPFPSKWSAIQLQQYNNLASSRHAEGQGKYTAWIANKDMPFKQRKEWLQMFPKKPAAFMPYMPSGEWAEWLWRGKWATDHPYWGPKLSSGLGPVLSLLAKE